VSALQRRGIGPTPLGVAGLLGLCLLVGVMAGVNPKYAVFGVLGIAFVIVVFNNLVVGLAIYAAMSFLEVLTVGGAGASFDKVAGLLLFLSWVASRATAPRASTRALMSRHPAMVAWMCAFIAWSVISVLWAFKPGVSLETGYREALQMLVVPIIYSAVRERRDALIIVTGYLVGACLSVLYTIAISRPQTANAAADTSRLVGSIGEANEAATVLVAALALAVGVVILARRTPRLRGLMVASFILAPIGLVLTLSRGGLLAAAATMVMGVVVGGRWRRRAGKIAVWTVLLLAGYFFLLAPATALKRVTSGTTSGRNDVWIVGWRMFVARPLIGVGAGNFQYTSSRYLQRPGLITSASDFIVAPKVAHNTYLEELAELGIFGLISLLGFIIAGAMTTLKAAHVYERLGEPGMELLARCVLLGLVAFLAADFFLSGLLFKQLWLVFALAPALLKLAEIERNRLVA
jgi:O-antigen ligase